MNAPAPSTLPSTAPLFHAMVENADWTEILAAVRQGVDWDTLRTRSGLSALGKAVLDDEAMLIGHLLDAGASPHPFLLFNGELFSPLWAALRRQHEASARCLLDAGANPNDSNEGRSPLVYTAIERMVATTRALCQAGALPDSPAGPSPLHLWVPHMVEQHPRWGLQFGSPDPILALLDAGADADVRNAQGQSVPDAARQAWAAFLGGPQASLSAEITLVALERSLLRRAADGMSVHAPPRVIKRL